MRTLKLLPGKGTKITSLTTSSQATGALDTTVATAWLVRVVGVNAHIRSGVAGSTTAVSNGTDLYLANGDTVVVELGGTTHNVIAAIADSGSGGTVYVYPVVGGIS